MSSPMSYSNGLLPDRVLVLVYSPSADWYGVDELSAGEGLDNSYRYGAADFASARDTLQRLLEPRDRCGTLGEAPERRLGETV